MLVPYSRGRHIYRQEYDIFDACIKGTWIWLSGVIRIDKWVLLFFVVSEKRNGYWYSFAWTSYHRKADLTNTSQSPRVRRFGFDFRNGHILVDLLPIFVEKMQENLICMFWFCVLYKLLAISRSLVEGVLSNVSKDVSFHNLILNWEELESLIRKNWSNSVKNLKYICGVNSESVVCLPNDTSHSKVL